MDWVSHSFLFGKNAKQRAEVKTITRLIHCWLHGENAIGRGGVRAVVRRMGIVCIEKALVRSVLRDGSCVWGVIQLTDVPLGRGEHV